MADYRDSQEQNYIDDLDRRIAILERQLLFNQAKRNAYLGRVSTTNYPTPVEGQQAVDTADDQHAWYANGQWRKSGRIFHIKVVSDFHTVVTGNGKFIFEIPKDLDGAQLIYIESYVTTVSSSGKPTIQIRNVMTANDLLSTKCEIEVNEKNSKDAVTQPVINTGTNAVAWGDHLAVDVDIAGTGAKGLGVILTF